MWIRLDLKTNAKIAFRRNYWTCVAVSILAALLSGELSNGTNGAKESFRNVMENNQSYMSPIVSAVVFSGFLAVGVIGILFVIFVGNIIKIGRSRYFMENREHPTKASQLFFGFRNGRYANTAITMFLKGLYVFLWSLLLVVPGIIKDYAYRLVPYILSENPNMNKAQALRLSEQMMYGHKMEAFILDLSFLGWHILGMFTCGILEIFYVSPYVDATNAEFYAAVKSEALQKGITTEYELPGHYYETY